MVNLHPWWFAGEPRWEIREKQGGQLYGVEYFDVKHHGVEDETNLVMTMMVAWVRHLEAV
jgi:hypothetical protein